MRLVIDMGAVYKLSDKAYLEVLRRIARNESYNLHEIGGKFLGNLTSHLTDMRSEDARDTLRYAENVSLNPVTGKPWTVQ